MSPAASAGWVSCSVVAPATLLLLLLRTTLVMPSVNVTCATSPDGFATAVAVNVAPKSFTSTIMSVFVNDPLPSATDVNCRSGNDHVGSSCTVITTVSPGAQPLPLNV